MHNPSVSRMKDLVVVIRNLLDMNDVDKEVIHILHPISL